MKVMNNGKELHVSLGPNFKTVLAWSTPLAPAGGGGRGGGGGGRAGQGAPAAPSTPSGGFPRAPARGPRGCPSCRSPRRGCARADRQGIHRVRTDGGDHQRAQPRAQG